MTPAGRPRRARKRGCGFLLCPCTSAPRRARDGPRRLRRCPPTIQAQAVASPGERRRCPRWAAPCPGQRPEWQHTGHSSTPGSGCLSCFQLHETDAAAQIGAASTTRTAPEGQEAGRRPRHGSTKKRVPFGHPLSICIAQFALVLVERVAGQPCQLHDLCV